MERHEDENDHRFGSDWSAVNYHHSSDSPISLVSVPTALRPSLVLEGASEPPACVSSGLT